MSKKHKSKPVAFNPPVRYPGGKMNDAAIITAIKKNYAKEMNEASSNSFNLAMSAAIIASRDMGMSVQETQEFLQRAFGVLDDVADDLSRIEEMMRLVESWGIKIYDRSERTTDEASDAIRKKTAVFELLENGLTEIEDILKMCKSHNIKIDYREACAYRWEFNKVKYYKYLEENMSRKDEAFKLFDEGLDNAQVAEQLGLKRSSIAQYRYLWKNENEMEDTMAKNKVKAESMIKNGASKDDLIKELGITEAAAIRYLDMFNTKKDDEGDIEIMTDNMKQAFALFDKAYSNSKVTEKLGLGKATVNNYRAEWVRINKKDLSTDEMAEILAGRNAEVVILEHKEVFEKKVEAKKDEVKTATKKHFEANKAGKSDEPVAKAEESKPEEKSESTVEVTGQASETVEVPNEDNTNVGKLTVTLAINKEQQEPSIFAGTQGTGFHYNIVELPNGLKKKVKVYEVVEELLGEYASYKFDGELYDMEIDGQVISFKKDEMIAFANEMLKVANM